DPQQFVPILEQYKIHRMIMVPSILKILLDDFPDLGERLTNLKYLTFSGEPVSIDLYNTFKRAVPKGIMLNLYGASECAADGSFCDDNIHPFDDRVPIGRPIDNTKIYILDEKMEPVPIGMSGEIYISGDCIAHGYYNRPDLTAERFIQDPFSGVEGMMMFRTGDFGRYLSNSQVEYLGRSDSQVKIRGIRIELGEIEKVLNKHPLVKQSIVMVKQDRLGDKALAAYLKVEPEGLNKPSAFWRSHTLEHLPSYMVPTYFVAMLEFPHTPNGKINRTELPDPIQAMSERQMHDSTKGDKLDLDDVDLKMLEIWCEILKIDHVQMDDDFFDLGGHSVLAVQLFKRIEDMFGVRFDLTLILEHASPSKLADLVRKPLLEKNKFEYLVNLNSGSESLPSLYCVHGAGGNILFLRDWFKYLDDIPLWAFKSAGVDGSINLPGSIEEISQNYMEELLQVQPEGPYWLCGYSVGGIIALEMAHQLTELGHSVAHIFLIDTLHPQVIEKKTSVLDVLKKVRQDPSEIGNFASRLTNKLSGSKPLSNEAQAIQEHISNGDFMPIELREGFLYSYLEDLEKNYHPKKPYKGNVTLFRAMQIWEMYSHVAEDGNWGDLFPNLSVKQVEGDHFTVVNKPGIEFILSEIKKIITH
ncbi:MAG: thioesterase domain-containing protein, partial [Chloroflexota bacterium]